MGAIADVIPFAKEMLSHRPCRGLLKVYLVGSILVLLGAAGGLVETVLLPFLRTRPQEEESEAEILFMKTWMENKLQLKTETFSGCW